MNASRFNILQQDKPPHKAPTDPSPKPVPQPEPDKDDEKA